MRTKTIYIISGVIGVIFIVFIIILKIVDQIKLGGLIVFSVLVIFIVAAVDLFFTYKGTGFFKKDKVEKPKITKEEAETLTRTMLESPKYAEYEKEVLWEEVAGAGEHITPIYFKMLRGEFDENLIYGVVINMVDPQRGGVIPYDANYNSIDKIKGDMRKRANSCAERPKEEVPLKITRSFDPLSGRSVEMSEPTAVGEKEEKGGVKLS